MKYKYELHVANLNVQEQQYCQFQPNLITALLQLRNAFLGGGNSAGFFK